MATQTFKIGLSDTDKQNMAQDVYERLIDMCFDEYDSANTYNEGDFVVYEDVLYKCKEDNVTGAWDSSKWETATFQDLVDDVEGAVASVNGKANIIDLENGTLVVAKAQIAQQIANVGDDVGSTQDEPFIFQATATDNGITSAETAPIAKHLEKQGNSVVVNQHYSNYNFASDTGYYVAEPTYLSGAVANNKLTLTVLQNFSSGVLVNFSCDTLVSGHKYLIVMDIASTNGNNTIKIGNYALGTSVDFTINQGTKKSCMMTFQASAANTVFQTKFLGPAVTGNSVDISFACIIDITQWGFSADEIDDLTAHPENFFRYYQGSLAYNAGTLATSNGRYLKTICRQQWDEEWELGGIDTDTGAEVSTSSRIRAKNLTRVIPNTVYYGRTASQGTPRVAFYDKDNNYLGYASARNLTFTTPSNCVFIRVFCDNAYGTTYNHDITISLYYADGVDYDKYFAYEEHTYDTGTETLLSAGSVRDIKLPSGEITRKVGVLDLGGSNVSYSYTSDGQYPYFRSGAISSLVKAPDNYTKANITCVLETQTAADIRANGKMGISVDSTGYLRIALSDMGTDPTTFKASLSGVYLYYELANPTTEQGTSFPENIDVDNYGSMLWLDTSSNSVTIPQGSQFFYPADYVEFLDSLYTRSKDNGDTADVTNIVVQSEIDDTALASRGYIKLASITGYDATKTQTLKNVEGTFTWVDD